MRIQLPMIVGLTTLVMVGCAVCAQEPTTTQSGEPQTAAAPIAPKPEDTELWQPVPQVVTPGADCNASPSDAIILFDGKNLEEWVSAKDKSPAKWTVADGVITVNKSAGNIQTKRSFSNYQLHIECKVPENITGSGQAR